MAAMASDATELSAQYETPLGLAHSTVETLKDRIKLHYDLASDYYLKLWGEHIHHGYWPTPESEAIDSKERAQVNLIELLLSSSQLQDNAQVLDVGCGVGGTARYLASTRGCTVTGITISSKQVEIAQRLSRAEMGRADDPDDAVGPDDHGYYAIGKGKVRFMELDAEKMGEYFSDQKASFDAVWISEALSHFPNKRSFFDNAAAVLKPGGKLVVADWFKDVNLEDQGYANTIKPIEDGMLLPALHTQPEYVALATQAGLAVFCAPNDISKQVCKTWDITWSLVQNPSLWAFALSQGRDGIAFLQSFRAMRRGYADGTFRYAVMVFRK